MKTDTSLESVLAILQALECELHEPAIRGNRERLEELLHPGFREFGRSGAEYRRAQVIQRLPAEATPARIHAQGFAAFELAPSVFLLTYQSAQVGPSGSLENYANRSSIWQLGSSGWQLVFHQGTPADGFSRYPA